VDENESIKKNVSEEFIIKVEKSIELQRVSSIEEFENKISPRLLMGTNTVVR